MENVKPVNSGRRQDSKSKNKVSEKPQKLEKLKVEMQPDQTQDQELADLVVSGGFIGVAVADAYEGSSRKIDVTLLDVTVQKTVNRVNRGICPIWKPCWSARQ